MKKVREVWAVKELRQKLLFTAMALILFRLGCMIPVLFVNPNVLRWSLFAGNGNMFDFLNMVSGGALSQCSLFALGISPYINASIVMQLLCVAIPRLEAVRKETNGKEQMEKYTYLLSLVLSVLLAGAYTLVLARFGALQYDSGAAMWLSGLAVMVQFVVGSQGLYWLSKKIDTKGIGNGVSVIIFAGVLTNWNSILAFFRLFQKAVLVHGISDVAMATMGVEVMLSVLWLATCFNGGEYRIPIQYSGRQTNNAMLKSSNSYIPIKLMASGALPAIFASTVISIPQTIGLFWGAEKRPELIDFLLGLNVQSAAGMILYVALIVFFNHFYVSSQYDAVEMANQLRANGGSIPGWRPGKPTIEYLEKVFRDMTRVGSAALAVLVCIPMIAQFVLGPDAVPFLGTSVLILTSCASEFFSQVKSHLAARSFRGKKSLIEF